MSARDVPGWVDFLARAGQMAPSADNSQPWRFVWDGSDLSLHMHEERGKTGLGLEHPANLMAMGAVIENLQQAAVALGMPPEVLRVDATNATGCMARINWDGPDPVELPDPLPDLFRRHTNRGPFAGTPLTEEVISLLAPMQEGPARILVVTRPESRKRWAGLVRDASQIRFQTEDIHRWLAGSLRFTPAEIDRGDGLDVATLLLPPGAVWLLRLSLDWQRMTALNRFGGFRLFAFLEAAMLQQCGALVVVAGPVSGTAVEVAAGRLLERVWIALNGQGLAVHPYYVLPDQLFRLRAGRVASQFTHAVGRITEDVAELLGSRDETALMLLRVGSPKVVDPIRSRRLPVENNLTLLTSQ
ncbi:MAG: hypothetical protein V5B60_12185 [Accumulibacter sp.]|jgi:nitroreductase|uniref:hypothetical protein n=1 Tax=Accumulibacter sp. TaxID=2053492 RepID=UPI002FC33096